MSQSYVTAMEHAEWQAKKVIKKYFKSRPLGQIEARYNYLAPQPVLSCRSVDIDACGTRTYQAKTRDEILSDQHRLIHEVYTKARTFVVSPTEQQPKINRVTPTKTNRILQSLQVEGQGTRRAKTAKVESLSQSFSSLHARSSAKGKKKPIRAKSAIAEYIRTEPDTTVDENSKKCSRTSTMIKDTWKTQNRALDEGKYVRGKQGGPSVSSKAKADSSHIWMSFGGGQNEQSAGLIDAFTGMKATGNFTIDGTTGIAVTKQLHKGDKIHVGRNGSPLSYMTDNDLYRENTLSSMRSNDTYFSMDDLLKSGNIKLLTPSPKSDISTRPVKGEVKSPAVFYRLSEIQPIMNRQTRPQRSIEDINAREGYVVTQRKSARKNIDGTRHRPSSNITHLTIEKGKLAKEDTMTPNMEHDINLAVESSKLGPHLYQEIQRSVQKFSESPIDITARAQVVPPHNSVASEAAVPQTPLGLDENPTHEMGSVLEESPQEADALSTQEIAEKYNMLESSSDRQNMKSPAQKAISKSAQDLRRPGSSVSRVSLDGGLVIQSAEFSQGFPQRAKSAGSSLRHNKMVGYRNNSRPPPKKPSLHKSTAASGASIKKPNQNGGSSTDAEYIQIHQQLHINPETKSDTPVKNGITSRQRDGMAVDSVSNHNIPAQDEGEDDTPSVKVNIALEQETANSDLSANSSHINSARNSVLDTGRESPQDNEVKYAFEIPTGETETELSMSFVKV